MRTSTRFPSSRFLSVTGAVVLTAGLAACGAPPQTVNNSYPASSYPTTTYPTATTTSPSYVEYGRITNIELVQTTERGRGSGVGAVLGGIAGGVVGNQIGSGSGRDVARIAGIAGGAVAGNAIERNRNSEIRESYRVSIQVDNGTTRAYDMAAVNDLRSGDRVRIENGVIYRI
ncbi:MAG: glycine zipper 2TM domain-containing protein [Polaromonas sp.]|nr:glycine zipper 2TM domain-containing protein [Polaromonas sp.]